MGYEQSIITVDDSSTMRRIIKNTLQKLGFETILEAGNGVEALEVMSKNKVDMIVTDWNMPEMDGLTFVKAVRAKDEYKDLPILMITTEAAKEDILTALRSGVNNYVVKPFTPETLHFNDSLKKLQTVSSAIEGAYSDLPAFEKVLNGVINDSKSASEDVLAFVDKINFNIDDIKENLELVRQFITSGDYARAGGMIDRLSECAIQGQDICCDIVSSLEFKEVTKSKINESIKVVNSLEEKLASVLIKLGIKQNVIDVDVLDKFKDTKEILQDQDLVDRLLKEFGV